MSLGGGARIARWLAIVIAIVAAIDPVVISMRRARPELAIVRGSAATDTALVERVAERLDDAFTLIDAPLASVAGTVVVGRELPGATSEIASPAFAVVPANRAAATIQRLDAPARAALESRAMIAATVRATGMGGETLDVSLRRGELVVDRVRWEVPGDDARRVVELTFVPTTIGATPLRVVVEPGAAAESASADLVVDVRDERWGVLFFDPRPSWMSTFVRRTIERDPRFVVTSRVVTSRGVSTEVGRPPQSLGDATALAAFDAIVIGSPDALGERDVAGLERYLRGRGGSVVMLLDQRASGAYQRLANVHEWSGTSNAAGIDVHRIGADSGGLRATSVAWPRTLPAGARSLARVRSSGADSATPHPVVWQMPVGGGQLIVSGALDAWRYRDPAVASFDVFWRSIIASAAHAALPPIVISLDSAVVAPSARASVSVTLRDPALAPIGPGGGTRARITASLGTPGGSIPIHLWPDGPIGTLRGTFRAPDMAGTYRIAVTSDGVSADAPLIVATSIARLHRDDADLVTAWVGSRGGQAIPESQLDALMPTLERTLRPEPRRETWYPMRSPWWLLPFAALLGAEWFWRRRGGLA